MVIYSNYSERVSNAIFYLKLIRQTTVEDFTCEILICSLKIRIDPFFLTVYKLSIANKWIVYEVEELS